MSRAEKAGRKLARSIIEMVHLMYQDNTAMNFYAGLIRVLDDEFTRRLKEKKNANRIH